jgi:protein-S-isoprenylcysteine O-methyltransferase Ste14
MKRWLFFAYGVACYAAFGATYAYLCGFTGNLLVPKSIDRPAATPTATAAAIDVLLLAAFGLQHSIMARPAFKRRWTRIVPQPIERATYVLASCLALGILVWLWRPINIVLWDVEQPVGRAVLWALFAAGWLMVPIVSLMISHFDLFGLRQVWLHLRGRDVTPLAFRTPYLYAHIRHPLYVGWALAFWATPTMTLGHLLYAGVLTAYMALAALVEERDLIAHFGPQYEEYRRRVPRYVPGWGRLLRRRVAEGADDSRLASHDPAVRA